MQQQIQGPSPPNRVQVQQQMIPQQMAQQQMIPQQMAQQQMIPQKPEPMDDLPSGTVVSLANHMHQQQLIPLGTGL